MCSLCSYFPSSFSFTLSKSETEWPSGNECKRHTGNCADVEGHPFLGELQWRTVNSQWQEVAHFPGKRQMLSRNALPGVRQNARRSAISYRRRSLNLDISGATVASMVGQCRKST